MDLRNLGYFVRVVEHDTFTAAAQAAFVSQPALSHGIDRLETELGVELFERIGRRVRLTAAGEALIGPARQALRDVETARAAVEAVAGLTAGHLDLGALPTLAVDPLATLVGAFRVAHPDVTIRLSDPADSATLVTMVTSGDVEIGITVGTPTDTGLEVRQLGHQDLLAVLPPGTALPGRSVDVRQLATFPLVAASPGTATRNQLEEAFGSAGAVPHVAVTTAQREAILPLVLAGAGATLFPGPLAEQAAALGAVVVPLRPSLTRTIVALHRPGPLSPAAAAFLDLALG